MQRHACRWGGRCPRLRARTARAFQLSRRRRRYAGERSLRSRGRTLVRGLPMTRCHRHVFARSSRICWSRGGPARASTLVVAAGTVSARANRASRATTDASRSARVRVCCTDFPLAGSLRARHRPKGAGRAGARSCRRGRSARGVLYRKRPTLHFGPYALVHPLVHGYPEDPRALPLLRDLVGGQGSAGGGRRRPERRARRRERPPRPAPSSHARSRPSPGPARLAGASPGPHGRDPPEPREEDRLSAREQPQPARGEPTAGLVADFMATFAIFAGLVALVYYPGRIGPGAIFIALLAAAIGGSNRWLVPVAVVATTASWLAGMIIARLLQRPIF